eukprot:gene30040-39231_t
MHWKQFLQLFLLNYYALRFGNNSEIRNRYELQRFKARVPLKDREVKPAAEHSEFPEAERSQRDKDEALQKSKSIGVVDSVNKIVGVSNIPNDQQFELILVDQLSDLNFYVGSIHYGWVLEEEQGPLKVLTDALKNRQNHRCNALDLQTKCIEFAQEALRENKFSHLVTVFNQPVYNESGYLINIDVPTHGKCLAGFDIAGALNRQMKAKTIQRGYVTMALDTVVAPNAFVDVLKIDVEGHEIEVLMGSRRLFMNHQIGVAVIEINTSYWTVDKNTSLSVFKDIMSYNYSVRPVTCAKGSPNLFR